MTDHAFEWLEADGTGGFASGTATTIRSRRYHGLLLVATTPPTGRMMLVNGFDAWIEIPDGRVDLTAQRYRGDVVHPRGDAAIAEFVSEPWPTWRYHLPDGSVLSQEILATPPFQRVIVRWRLAGAGLSRATLRVRPFLSGRDYHALQRENTACRMTTERLEGRLQWQPYAAVPAIGSVASGAWRDDPQWYRHFLYSLERERGLDDSEDLASPGELAFDLSGDGTAVWAVGTVPAIRPLAAAPDPVCAIDAAIAGERERRAVFASPLERAADAYVVQRGIGKTIVAGYPWFTDWGRDTFIALRGLCLTPGRLEDARDILLEWSRTVSGGMLPNRFPDGADRPEYNAVDASLWYVVATGELLSRASGRLMSTHDRYRLERAVLDVLDGLAGGTRYGIRCDADGLLACGEAGVQLTWMDARVGDRVITPRIGKPVEVEALWINALEIGTRLSSQWDRVLARARDAFARRFWNGEAGCLYDVVDVDHVAGTADLAIRPNQILAVGGLPAAVIDGERARSVVAVVERELLTPLGLRTLAPGAPGYLGIYAGDPRTRDAAYHQGTAWPWLMGAFVDAWLRTRGNTDEARDTARARFLDPLLRHLDEAGLGHVSEIVDGDAPHGARGCPFQAWSVGELMRMRQMLAVRGGVSAAVR